MFEEEYELAFFKEAGYMRKVCESCGGGFWTLNEKETICGDTPCVEYSFIGNSPMNRAYSIDEVRLRLLETAAYVPTALKNF